MPDHGARSAAAGMRSAFPLLGLYAVSGFGTLALETLWMREIALRAGATVVAAVLVTVVFFASAAMGNLWGARLVSRSARPLGYYGRCEVAAGAAALAAFALSRWLWARIDVLPPAWTGQMAAAALLVGPPAFLSGVGFPSLAETFVPGADERTSRGGPFYGMNLLGAALGVAAGGVLLPWWIGVPRAFAVVAGLQIAAGLGAWHLASRAGSREEAPAGDAPGAVSARAWAGWALLVASGVLSLAAQSLLMVWARQVLEGSVYAICGVLTAFIGGLGFGALAAGRLRALGRPARELLGLFAGAGAIALFAAAGLGPWLVGRGIDLTGAGPAAMLGQALAGGALFLLPLSFLLGGVFPVAWEIARGPCAHQGRMLGFALAANKLGAAAGSMAGLFVLLPGLGLVAGTSAVAWGYAAIAGAAAAAWRPSKPAALLLLSAVGLGLWQAVRPHKLPGIAPGMRVVAARTGPYGPVAVIEDERSGSRQLLLNSRQRLCGTGDALSSQRHQSWVPLLFCRAPARAITIGMAAGISATAALDFPVERLDAVELVPEVALLAREHFSDWNQALFSDPRARVHIGDGRVVLARLPGAFDAIIVDLFFPNEDATANLYSREFFHLARRRLNPGGVFCLWLPCHQHTAGTAGTVVRTFLDVFPHALAVRANLDPTQPVVGLLGSIDPLPLSREFLAERLDSPAARRIARHSPFFRSPEHAWLLVAGDLRAAVPGFADFPATTDDRPVFAYIGPRRPPPRERLVGMTFLDWIGKRFTRPLYPSADLGATPPREILGCVRAANFYFAAAIARTVLPGDTRPEAARARQVDGYLQTARSLAPAAELAPDDLGR